MIHFILIKNISHFSTQEIACEKDSDCDNANCEYCLSKGYCRKYDSEYCHNFTCGVGDGDCSYRGKPCPSGLVCGKDNFLEFHPLLSHCRTVEYREVCIEKGVFLILHYFFISRK